MKKRIIALILALTLTFSSTITAFAENSDNIVDEENDIIVDEENSTFVDEENDTIVDEENTIVDETEKSIDVDTMTDAELLAYYAKLNDEEVDTFALSLTEEQLNRLANLLQGVELCSESSETHTVFKNTESTLAPGVTQNIKYAYAADGKQMVYYVAKADITRDDVVVQTSYYKQYEDQAMGMAKLTDQMAYAKQKYSNPSDENFVSEYYTPVAGVNASFYNMSTGQPLGITYIDGVSFGTNSYDNFFAILKDGTAVIDYSSNVSNYTGDKAIEHAVAGSAWLVRDGKDITANASGSYNVDRHSRTCVGVTADGKVVVMQLDGRQEPFSCGGTFHELAQIMLEQGCVAAINLDGGGSSTFVSRPEGEDEIKVINRPSDGSERAISAGLIIASLQQPTNIFDHATLTAENDYVTPNSEVQVSAVGVSTTNGSAEIPEDITWGLADETYGTIENGLFTSTGKVGDVIIEMRHNGQVVGSTTVHVVIPDIKFSTDSMTVPFNKTFSLNVTATTNNGNNKVVLKDTDIKFELSDSKMGTIDGWKYTTCDADSGVTEGTIIAKCVYDESKTAEVKILFGEASKITEAFEESDTLEWTAKSGYAKADKGNPTYGRFEEAEVKIVDEKTGYVRNGKYAIELTADFSTTTASGYKCIKFSFPEIDLKGATSVGMWMYIPVEDVKNLEFDIGGYEYYPEKHNISETGWYYVSAPVKNVGETLSSFTLYITDPDENYFNVFNKFKIYIDDITIDYSNATEDRENPYFEDVNVIEGTDSSASMNGQTIQTNTFTVKAAAKENLTGNYTGLDISTAKVYVDGVALRDGQYKCNENGEITVSEITLNNGTHTFRFEICDNNGNMGFITRNVVVNTENANVSVVRRNTKTLPLAGSVEYFDIVAKDADKVNSVSIDIDLDNLSTWETAGFEAQYGMEMTYSIDERTNTAHITLEKVSSVNVSGEAILASLPVRVWQTSTYLNETYINAGLVPENAGAENSTVSTPNVMWNTDRSRLVRMELKVLGAKVVYTDGMEETFTSKQMNIITEHNRYRSTGYYNDNGEYVTGDTNFVLQGKESTHVHTEKAIEDKSATCTEAGYKGRTYCVNCASVVKWGTIEKATGHTYELIDGVLKCTCDETFTGTWSDGKEYVDGVVSDDGWKGDFYYKDGIKLTGIQKVTAPDSSDEYYYDFGEDGVSKGKYTGLFYDGEVYRYSQLGKLSSGWKLIDEEWYYFRESTMAAATGDYRFTADVIYKFEENGHLTRGVWKNTSEGSMYYYGPTYYWDGWKEIDSKTYFFDKGYCYKGYRYVRESNSTISTWYNFGDTGAMVGKYNYTGLLVIDSKTYYLDNGISVVGLVKVDNDYYYFKSSDNAAVIGEYYVWNNNNLMPQGYYTFGEDGKMIIKDTSLNGIVEKDGLYYYYENGERSSKVGLIKVDNDYYYIKSGTYAAVTGEYYVWNNNDLLPRGYYTFDVNGKMIVKDISLNGIVEKDGLYYYYENGERSSKVGLIKVDNDYYYIKSGTYAAVTGEYYVWNNNDLLPRGYYTFDVNGKMIVKDISLNGIVEKDGLYYYYENGERSSKVGLIKVDNDYYYIKSGTYAAVTGEYYVWNNNDLLPRGYYTFDVNGKMIVKDISLNGIVEKDGLYYYYENGERSSKVGLIKVDNDYYYIKSGTYAAVTGEYYVWNNNDLLPRGYYTFDVNGKMIQK